MSNKIIIATVSVLYGYLYQQTQRSSYIGNSNTFMCGISRSSSTIKLKKLFIGSFWFRSESFSNEIQWNSKKINIPPLLIIIIQHRGLLFHEAASVSRRLTDKTITRTQLRCRSKIYTHIDTLTHIHKTHIHIQYTYILNYIYIYIFNHSRFSHNSTISYCYYQPCDCDVYLSDT